jgi:hypothetical protein
VGLLVYPGTAIAVAHAEIEEADLDDGFVWADAWG